MDEARLRELIPEVIGVLGRRGADFASAEDAVQDALVKAIAIFEAVALGLLIATLILGRDAFDRRSASRCRGGSGTAATEGTSSSGSCWAADDTGADLFTSVDSPRA